MGAGEEKKTLDEFKEALAREGVNAVLRQNARVIFMVLPMLILRVNVFNGSDPGKEFSAKGILEQLKTEQSQNDAKLHQKTGK